MSASDYFPALAPRARELARRDRSKKQGSAFTAAAARAFRRESQRSRALTSVRTSQLLREVLTKNPDVKSFTIQQIVDSLGESSHEASLMCLSIPSMLPVPGTSNLSGLPVTVIAGQMMSDKRTIRLPRFIQEKSVSRRSLSVAIKAFVPFLEMAEKAVKPRWEWLTKPEARRILALLIFLMALAIAVPIIGFNLPHALSIFTIAFGLAEHDGLVILIGIAAGLIALWVSGASVTGMMAGGWIRKLLEKAGLKWAVRSAAKWAAKFLKRLGTRWTTGFLLEWADRFLSWQPAVTSKRLGSTKEMKKGSIVRQSRNALRSAQRALRVAA